MNIEGMSDDQKRIRIAKGCGWKESDELWISPSGSKFARKRSYGAPIEDWEILPDYLNDLNEMHEAEKTFLPCETDQYVRYLWPIVADFWREQGKRTELFDQESIAFAIAHATARQRADAFLATLPEPEQDAK